MNPGKKHRRLSSNGNLSMPRNQGGPSGRSSFERVVRLAPRVAPQAAPQMTEEEELEWAITLSKADPEVREALLRSMQFRG